MSWECRKCGSAGGPSNRVQPHDCPGVRIVDHVPDPDRYLDLDDPATVKRLAHALHHCICGQLEDPRVDLLGVHETVAGAILAALRDDR